MVEVGLQGGVGQAREYFPRGMDQPEGGYRFSMDALLLASFARAVGDARVADLGAGCGVVGLGMLLASPEKGLRVTALDVDEAMVAACRENALRLGFSGVFEARRLDAGSAPGELGFQRFDLVVSNPPYRAPGEGRLCKDESRTRARFEVEGDLGDFSQAASRLLRQGGRFSLVHLAGRLSDMVRLLPHSGLEPKRIRFVHSRRGEPARLVLAEAVRGGKPGLIVEPPLILYAGEGPATKLTSEALAFCPFLGCNP